MLRKIENHPFILSVSAGVLLSLPFFNGRLWILAWFGFVPLFFAIENKSKLKAFFLAYFTGLIFWFFTIYWLVHVTLVGLVILVLYLAIYFGIFGLFYSKYFQLPTLDSILLIPSLWVILEYIRAYLFSGFGWALLGYSQYLNLVVIQISDVTGVWGVSFLVMLVNVAIKKIFSYKLQAKGFKFFITTCSMLVMVCGYGLLRLHNFKFQASNPKLRISVIQGNIPQELKWDERFKDYITKKYIRLTLEATKNKPDLIIYPEAAMPVVLEEESVFFECIKDLNRKIKIPLLLGAVTSRNNFYYNSAILISDGKLLNIYDKLHLVPFGEYIPLRAVFSFLESIAPIGDFSCGKEYTIFKLPTYNFKFPTQFSVLICFEDLFPELSRRFVKRGAQFLVNITNDAWFKKTPSPYQHLQASVFRAVENRLNLVRAANTGISGFIAPTGKIISLVKDESGKNIFIDGYVTEEILVLKGPLSFYTHFGDAFIFLLFSVCILKFWIKGKSQNSLAYIHSN